MAVSSPPEDMGEEVMCPLCMEYLEDPVSVDCGHNFCLGCITYFCEKWEEHGLLKCPLCRTPIRKENFQPNWQLVHMVAKLKFLSLNDKLCEKHQEKLQLFCKADEELVCQTCQRSPAHKQHPVVLLDEAAQEYKGKIEAQLKSLGKEKKMLVPQKLAEEIASQKTLAQIEAEKARIKSAFKQMHNVLEEKEDFWLAHLGDLEKEVKKKLKENIARISQKVTSISYLMREMEEKCLQPENEFLQNIKSTMGRFEKKPMEHVVDHTPELDDRLQLCFQKNSALEEAMGKFTESLEEALNKGAQKKTPNKAYLKMWDKVNVILDSSTAHPSLRLSEDLKNVRWEDKYQPLPDSLGRFEFLPCVLGCEKFSSGRHQWEVEVEEEEARATWAMGVAKESVARKEEIRVSVDHGIFAAGKLSVLLPCQLCAFTSPKTTPLILRHPLRKIRVYLDYGEGQVGFYDADTNELIFTFYSAAFSGERICPYFWVGRGVRLKC
ncbi:E3 ubiquitin-protein ligase TRIM15-like isoform X2 [Paroedura picta]|uniref:E3 ubiquitin-protein ligase TRIM15-like isoform X2 n=1 Tax=Paroedura picta TaxID=143630 RepID=UPI004057C478